MMTAQWHKSSYSNPNGACVEACWRKSRHSNSQGACVECASWRRATSCESGACLEAAVHGPGTVGIRDSQLGDASPVLEISPAAWSRFTTGLK